MPYAWKSSRGFYYQTDTATGHSCTDDAAQNPHRVTVNIVSWEES